MQKIIDNLKALPDESCDAASLQMLGGIVLDKLRTIKQKNLVREANTRIANAVIDTSEYWDQYIKVDFNSSLEYEEGCSELEDPPSPFDDTVLTKFLRSVKVHHLIDPADPLFMNPGGENFPSHWFGKCVFDPQSTELLGFSIGFSSKTINRALTAIRVQVIRSLISEFADTELCVSIFPNTTTFTTGGRQFELNAYEENEVQRKNVKKMKDSIPLLTLIPSLYAIIDQFPFHVPYDWDSLSFPPDRNEWAGELQHRFDVTVNWHTGKVETPWA